MKLRVPSLGLVLIMTICLAAWAADEKAPAGDYAEAFQQLKALVGRWEEVGEPGREISYHLTGNGSALMEEFRGQPSMTSVYHMDGEDILLTHYCNAGNQPRMKSASYDPQRKVLKFSFMDVTNLSTPEAYHTRELEILFRDEDHIELKFNGRKKGRDVPGVVSLIRRE